MLGINNDPKLFINTPKHFNKHASFIDMMACRLSTIRSRKVLDAYI